MSYPKKKHIFIIVVIPRTTLNLHQVINIHM